MKSLKKFLSQLRRSVTPKEGKAGSSLALVLMIGSALVIWVVCIMPLMVTTGTTAVQTQSSYDDYLVSRSSIEFCKSELEKIVESEVPYTFAVLRNSDGSFAAIPKKESGISLSSAYTARISADALDDTKDVPLDTDAGREITAICAAVLNSNDTSQYNITITTYNNGEKGLAYSAIYTLRGSLLIYPEAYKQSQALPLSDFVLVDGQLGPNAVWNSTIGWSSDAPTTSYTETLLPWIMDQDENYANSGEYPAVLKTTALAASSGVSIGTPIVEEPFTTQEWVMPNPVTAASTTAGDIWVSVDGTSVTVYLYTTAKVNVTDQCRIYFNGSTTVPTASGTYRITVDYSGTGEYDETEGAVNVLPRSGMVMSTCTVASSKHSDPSCKVTGAYHNSGTVDVYLTQITGAMYGYCEAGASADSSGKIPLTWLTDTDTTDGTMVISGLDASKTYYFYCYIPASIENNIYYGASNITYAGVVYPYKAETSLTDGEEYLVVYDVQNTNNISPRAMSYSSSLSVVTLTEAGDINAGVLYGEPDDSLKWTMMKVTSGSSTYWRFTQGTIDEDDEYEPTAFIQMARSGGGPGSNSQVQLSVGSSTENSDFTISLEQGTGYASRSFSRNQGGPGGPGGSSGGNSTTYYLQIGSSGCTASTQKDNNSKIYFIKVPEAAPAVSRIAAPVKTGSQSLDLNVGYGTNILSAVSGNVSLPEGVTLKTVYANGSAVSGTLNPGIYTLVGQVNEGTSAAEVLRYVSLGKVTVAKSALSSDDLSVAAQIDENDELKVTVSGTGWHNNGGIRYFGYQTEEEAAAGADFHWFSTTDASYSFRLEYGNYYFAIAESGNSAYSGTQKQSEAVKLEAADIELPEDCINEFIYTFDKSTGEVVWYKLPTEYKVTPSKVTLVFGIPVGTTDITWTDVYSSDVRFYGVTILGSQYEDLNSVLQLSQSVGITTVNGHTSSVLRGSSLYFMGSSNSINTYGNDIYLTADLLVLGNSMTGGGSVYVAPYSTGETKPGDTLLFAVSNITRDGTTIFEAKQFYRIPADTDIYNVSAAKAAEWHVGTTTSTAVQYYFRQNIYPDINLDIAYASREQLDAIVSGETIGWTNNGVLSGSNTSSSNAGYAVCAYVTEISGAVSYKANRVLIAAKTTAGDYTLNVPANLTITTRYLSVDADQIVQGSGKPAFTIKNLGQDSSFIQEISNALGFTSYGSKSLQMDYERSTRIVTVSDGTYTEKPQICRYDDGTNIFSGSQTQSLMAPYTTSEIEDLFGSGSASWLGSTLKTVDRYVSVSCDDSSGTLSLGAAFTSVYNIYANYVYIDGSVNTISISRIIGSSDITINSQESGYTTSEYMGLFQTQSAESYSGTLICFAEDVTIKVSSLFSSKSYPIEAGFYYVSATDGSTSLTKLSTDKADYWVEPDTLKEYSVYIKPDGTLSNAYVDTGLFDNSSAGLGGFSGGNMQ